MAFGPSPADLAAIEATGLERWMAEQLEPGVDPAVEGAIRDAYPTLQMSIKTAYDTHLPQEQRLKQLGIPKDTPREMTKDLVAKEDLPRQLTFELSSAKLYRATNSKRQFEEVIVDFWFNHFNVSADKGRSRWMVGPFERDAIRPHVFGTFRQLLGATAHHPAMLFYLDNWLSTKDGLDLSFLKKKDRPKGDQTTFGLNENYARELLELHTVGVNAGYTQSDVREAARALTGWSIQNREKEPDFGQFIYRPLAHDDGEKRIFGLTLPPGGGASDGEQLLDSLASHPATAHSLATKLCRRFIGDTASAAAIARVEAAFKDSRGDLRVVYRTLFSSPEFWSADALGAQIKTPLEFLVSALRGVGTVSSIAPDLLRALEALGQPLYRCQPPTGYSDAASTWTNAGGLLTRINVGLKLLSGRVPGVALRVPRKTASTPDETIDIVAQALFGAPPSPATRSVVLKALAPADVDTAPADGETRPVDARFVAGLLLGSPEFQKQ